MAILKIICNADSVLYIDQDRVCELKSNKLHKQEISTGVYIVDIISTEETQSFDLKVERTDQQFLKRIDFSKADEESSSIPHANQEAPILSIEEGVTRALLNNKHGIYSSQGEILLPCIYDDIKVLSDPRYRDKFVYVPCIDHKYGLFSPEGEKILDCIYEEISPITDLPYVFAVKFNGKFALLTHLNSIVTGFIYDEIFDEDVFSNEDDYDYEEEGFIYRLTYKVRIGNQLGIIDDSGNVLIECKYQYLRRCSTLTPDMKFRYEVGNGSLHGIIIEGGKMETEMIYEGISDLSIYNDSIEAYVIAKNGKKAIMALDKRLLSDFEYDTIIIHHDKNNRRVGFSVESNGLWGFIDEQFRLSIKCLYASLFPIVCSQRNRVIAFRVSNEHKKQGVIAKNGSEIVPMEYDIVFEEYIHNHNFVSYSNVAGHNKWHKVYDPFKSYDLTDNQYHQLKCTDYRLIRNELESILTES